MQVKLVPRRCVEPLSQRHRARERTEDEVAQPKLASTKSTSKSTTLP